MDEDKRVGDEHVGRYYTISNTQRQGKHVIARLGLIADTHMPERLLALPDTLFEVFQGVDLILHAGDLGELWVLDRLSTIAPVVAVHGNDDTPEAQHELPYQQVIAIAGQRILLWHSHYQDPAEDRARRGRSWEKSLKRIAERGRQVGAKIIVFGHFHVPMVYSFGDITLINPGALASGTFFSHQVIRTVARLQLHAEGNLFVTHTDLDHPGEIYSPEIDWGLDIEAAVGRFQETIVEPSLGQDVHNIWRHTYDDFEAVKCAILPLCHRCWRETGRFITRDELLSQIEADVNISLQDKEKLFMILSAKGSRS